MCRTPPTSARGGVPIGATLATATDGITALLLCPARLCRPITRGPTTTGHILITCRRRSPSASASGRLVVTFRHGGGGGGGERGGVSGGLRPGHPRLSVPGLDARLYVRLKAGHAGHVNPLPTARRRFLKSLLHSSRVHVADLNFYSRERSQMNVSKGGPLHAAVSSLIPGDFTHVERSSSEARMFAASVSRQPRYCCSRRRWASAPRPCR